MVERAYKGGAVSILCATSTMAAGVNLPARRVIFRCGAGTGLSAMHLITRPQVIARYQTLSFRGV